MLVRYPLQLHLHDFLVGGDDFVPHLKSELESQFSLLICQSDRMQFLVFARS